MKGIKIAIFSILSLLLAVLALWIYKFNLTNDDIYVEDEKWNIIKYDEYEQKKENLKTSFKGFELYSWQEDEKWHFSLLEGTNRMKTCEEIKEVKVSWIEEWKKIIANIDKTNLFQALFEVEGCPAFKTAPFEISNK